MLSGIVDLRTPLTRIKLKLAFIEDKKISEKLSEDVEEMEKMLNEYLQFARSTSSEVTNNFKNLILQNKYENNILKHKLQKYNNGTQI